MSNWTGHGTGQLSSCSWSTELVGGEGSQVKPEKCCRMKTGQRGNVRRGRGALTVFIS